MCASDTNNNNNNVVIYQRFGLIPHEIVVQNNPTEDKSRILPLEIQKV